MIGELPLIPYEQLFPDASENAFSLNVQYVTKSAIAILEQQRIARIAKRANPLHVKMRGGGEINNLEI
ncbi:MAG: hypothetical protein IJG38_06150 [Thermoguttaceae bacterium]|nr:hypothetical protein [Thermoguttaceae bacterium]